MNASTTRTGGSRTAPRRSRPRWRESLGLWDGAAPGRGPGGWTGLSADLGFSGLAACEGPPHSWNRCEALPQDAPQVHTCEAFGWWRVLALNRSPPAWPFHARAFHLRLCLPSLSPGWAAGTSGANPGTQGQGTGRSSDPAPISAPPYLCRAPISGRLGLGSPGPRAPHTASAGQT